MDIKINSVSFTGKNEVLYALNKAAQNAKHFAYDSQFDITANMTIRKQIVEAKQNASMKAYLDMALRDESFIKTINELKPSELSDLRNLLQPIQTQHSLVNPMGKYKSVMQEVLEHFGRKKASVEVAVSQLCKELGL